MKTLITAVEDETLNPLVNRDFIDFIPSLKFIKSISTSTRL